MILPLAVTANTQPIRVTVDGIYVVFPDQQPISVDSRTLVPVRGVFEQMGFEVTWRGETNTAVLTRNTLIVEATIGSSTLVVVENGQRRQIPLDVPAQSINNRTMLPLRAVAEATGATVEWNGATQTATITTTNASTTPPTTFTLPQDLAQHFNLLNETRATNGLEPVRHCPHLTQAAQQIAEAGIFTNNLRATPHVIFYDSPFAYQHEWLTNAGIYGYPTGALHVRQTTSGVVNTVASWINDWGGWGLVDPALHRESTLYVGLVRVGTGVNRYTFVYYAPAFHENQRAHNAAAQQATQATLASDGYVVLRQGFTINNFSDRFRELNPQLRGFSHSGGTRNGVTRVQIRVSNQTLFFPDPNFNWPIEMICPDFLEAVGH